MRRIAVKETYKDGQVIIKEGGYGEGTYLVISGKVRITKKMDKENLHIAVLEKGDFFGEMSFLDRQPRSASATAVGDVELGLIDKDFLEEEINKTSEEFRHILYTLAERLRTTSSLVVKLIAENHALKKQS
ncbi:MAG: cyclic nucleotide-binding domain-containing protein [Nitrospirota bacterium]|uniref:Cyclic nucleotide-binding domain protein n=1 Tax=Candidatus Magnetominusculus xianensis TaxID=1748249 RepID=A0ABR5SFU0_9BACT|nr:cyclic nucleotide-binding domain-containing protein [Candidatus Magnetominusculus xianensis]KWT84998.1 cyclic nucleotide-binding domain protein [Candidatus Magnetominusculus xianensis]MBF0404536.1 cyclic nucleotide-binding domain-containing protein [Nitrospirota bacterium]